MEIHKIDGKFDGICLPETVNSTKNIEFRYHYGDNKSDDAEMS